MNAHVSCSLENADMSVDLLRLKSGTSESNSRAIESMVRALMTSDFAELGMHFDVERPSITNIVLVPTYDKPMTNFEGELELLKEQLFADPRIMMYVNLSILLDLATSEEESDDGSGIDQHIQSRDWRFTPDGEFIPTQTDRSTPQPAAAYQYGRDTGDTAGLFGRAGTTVVTHRRPDRGQFVVTPYRMNTRRELRRRRTVLKCCCNGRVLYAERSVRYDGDA